jgi:hypothetical protein
MKFETPLSVAFRSIVKEGKFFTLDGEKEVKAPYYSKFINSVNDLTGVEVHYILIKYATYNKHLGQLSKFIDQMKI